ncbi:MAG: hypothetical protein CL912_21735 [Deltaproteobacteria bacterium]|nr:hypothetical protein [Deltaproteobacteria bacterium]
MERGHYRSSGLLSSQIKLTFRVKFEILLVVRISYKLPITTTKLNWKLPQDFELTFSRKNLQNNSKWLQETSSP